MIRPDRNKGQQHWSLIVGGVLVPAMGLLTGCAISVEPFVWIEWPAEKLGVRSLDELERVVHSYHPSESTLQRVAAMVGAKPAAVSNLVELNIWWWNSQPPTIRVECTAKNQRLEWARAYCQEIAPEFVAHAQSSSRGASSPPRAKTKAGWI
jgi:hypothetical protein